jgi:hypothetical protein
MIFVIVGGALFLIGIAAAAIAWPLLQERKGGPGTVAADETAADPLVELTARRDSVYQALRELRFDHQVGKVSEDDFKVFDAQLKGQAIAVLKEIDSLKQAEADPVLDAKIEAEIAALRHTNGREHGVEPGTGLVVGGQGAPASYCPTCGTKARSGDSFCGKCGTSLG